jgi:manganese transport protein
VTGEGPAQGSLDPAPRAPEEPGGRARSGDGLPPPGSRDGHGPLDHALPGPLLSEAGETAGRLRAYLHRILPGEAQVARAAHESLTGQRRGLRAVWPFLGPAFIASVAYVDPGNFATNFAGGAKYGYLLLWVIVAANLIAMLIQSMSAKLGIATGKNLAEVCRDRFPRPLTLALWVQAEVIAIATDLAELLGAALGLHLLFGLPLFASGVAAGAATFAILYLQQHGFRDLEAVIAGLVGAIVLAFALQVVLAKPSATGVASGLVPGFGGSGSVYLAIGILGATVMPHVIYLHSALTQHRIEGRSEEQRRRISRFERIDVIIAMTVAGVINMSMLVIAAAVFHAHGLTNANDLTLVYHRLPAFLGAHTNVVFGIALLASGLSSSTVGTMAGQTVMQGFIHRSIPLLLRRAITLIPPLVVLGVGLNASDALVLSQVVLSFGIPFALLPLLWFCRDRSLMRGLVNTPATSCAAAAVATLIVALNLLLLYATFSGA